MLVITLQLSYTQETIYNALMNSNAKRKKIIKYTHAHTHIHSPTVNVLTAAGSIHYTLPCKLNREESVTLTLPYSALSMWLYDLFVCHLAFKLIKKKKKRILKKYMPVHHYLSISVEEEKKNTILCCFLYTLRL